MAWSEEEDCILWNVLGKNLRIKSQDPEQTKRAMQSLELRINELQKEKAFSAPLDHCLLLLLEMAMEREDFQEQGKALLKRTDQLVDCISEMTRSS